MTEERKGFYFELLELLEQDPEKRFYADNGKDLLRNKVYECAMKMDKDLIKLLLSNDRMKEKFFTDVDGTLVFDKTAFGWAINNKAFLQDSYTRFKNTIGLIDSKEQFISSKNDVVLSFPYKDCVLEGGQTKEDQKRGEIFYNELLAPDDVDRLLAPKVFTNMKRYTKDGEESIIEFKDDDNLLIKGNNLLALSSILKRYEGKIKCIYIDPPYNTGNDGFNYNDSFNHSSWLVFMKNRLLFAKKLLRENGSIFVHCDDNEQAYLKVLMDEIFGKDNFVETITIVNNPRGRDYGGIANMHEFIHIYKKSEITEFYDIDDPDKKFPYSDAYGGFELRELRNRNTAFNISNRPNLCYPFYINENKHDENGLYEISLEKNEKFYELYPLKSQGIQTVWRWGKEKSQNNLNINIVAKKMQNGSYMIVEKYRKKSKMARSVWYDKFVNSERGTLHLKELFGEKIFNYPKPEDTIYRILQIATLPGDIVLDFHVGSGTTCAVSHKFQRKYIGIEQMNYIDYVTKERLKKVIYGEQGGISEAVNWHGGGSFVYCELKELNHKYIDEIQVADDNKLNDLYKEITDSEFISYKADINKLKESEKDFIELPIEDKRSFLIQVLDKNLLYVNYCDMEDEDLAVTEEEKAFAISFYGEGV